MSWPQTPHNMIFTTLSQQSWQSTHGWYDVDIRWTRRSNEQHRSWLSKAHRCCHDQQSWQSTHGWFDVEDESLITGGRDASNEQRIMIVESKPLLPWRAIMTINKRVIRCGRVIRVKETLKRTTHRDCVTRRWSFNSKTTSRPGLTRSFSCNNKQHKSHPTCHMSLRWSHAVTTGERSHGDAYLFWELCVWYVFCVCVFCILWETIVVFWDGRQSMQNNTWGSHLVLCVLVNDYFKYCTQKNLTRCSHNRSTRYHTVLAIIWIHSIHSIWQHPLLESLHHRSISG